MLDTDYGLPSEFGGVLDSVECRLARAVKHGIEPEVVLEPLGGLVLVCRQGDLPDSRTPLHFDEPDLDERLGVFRVGTPRDQIEPPVLGLHALHQPAPRFLVGDDVTDGDLLDFGILDHRCKGWAGPFRVGENPGTPQVGDLRDGAMPLFLQFPESPFKPLVEAIQMGLSLRDQPVESLDGVPLDLTVEEVSKLTLLAVDERVQ